MIKHNTDFTLYLVTDRRWLGERTLWDGVEEAIRGGVTLVQLREKEISSKEYLELAQRVKEVTDRHGIPLIINDRIDIAMAIDADGVHLGPEDLPVPIARKLLGDGKIIGASAASVDEALLFQAQGADYLGVGAVFPTATKRGTEKVGLDDLRGDKIGCPYPGGGDRRHQGGECKAGHGNGGGWCGRGLRHHGSRRTSGKRPGSFYPC